MYCSPPAVHRICLERKKLGARLLTGVIQLLLSGSVRYIVYIINGLMQEDPGMFLCKYMQIIILTEQY